MASLAQLWGDIYAARFEWAKRGYDRVIEGLSPQIRDNLPKIGKDSVSVVLYGPTQVGKTTLLLTLLGIAEAEIEAVDNVLRGTREPGQSSTAMAMLYERSSDEQWHLRVNGGDEAMDGTKLCLRLKELRAAMERKVAGHEPAVVGIPACYFAPQAVPLPDIRIFDLPGGKAQNPVEVAYAAQVAGHYLPHADLVLLVGQRHTLGFLNPQDFTLPGIRDWRYTPERFLTVTTRSFSLASVASWLRQEPAPTRADLQDILLRDIASHKTGLEKLPGLAERCFQLEFGKSWDELRKTEPVLHTKAERLNAETLAALHEKLASAAQPLNRLRRMHQTHETVSRIRAAELKKQWEIQVRKRKGVRKARETEHELRKALDEAKQRARGFPDVAALMAVQRRLQAGILDAVTKAVSRFFKDEWETRVWTTTYLLERVNTCRAQLFRIVTSAVDEFEANGDEAQQQHRLVVAAFEANQPQLQPKINDVFVSFVRYIDKYWWKSYSDFSGSNFDKDCKMLIAAQREAQELLQDFVASACARVLVQRKEFWRKAREDAKADILALGDHVRFAERKTAAREKIRRDHAKDMLAFASMTRQDKRHAQDYRVIMEAALADELRAGQEQRRREASPTRRFMGLLGGLAIYNAARSLREIQ